MDNRLLRHRQGGVEVLTIDCAGDGNAVNQATALAIRAALEECERDIDVRVVILTGSGDETFCAGANESHPLRSAAPTGPERPHETYIRRFTKPLICAANGSAFDEGFELLLDCDLVIAADHARFGYRRLRSDLASDAAAFCRLPRRIAPAIALEIVLCTEPIDARRAYGIGMVNRVVSRNEVVPVAMAFAERICENAPLAVRLSKELVIMASEHGEAISWERNNDALKMILSSPDAREGALAFAEKRRPIWQGR